jgi:DNA repair protein RadA/Sms
MKWMGQCPSCREWNTFKEFEKGTSTSVRVKPSLSDKTPPKRLIDVNSSQQQRFSTEISELDRVLGGGVVRDSVISISASPGMGKSTLLGQVANNVAKKDIKVLYISGEESEEQVKARAERTMGGKISENIWIKSETNMDLIKEYIKEIDPKLIIIDSIQTVYLNEYLPSRAGGVSQITACTDELIAIAKNQKRAIFMVVHVTKDEEMGGPKTLEHMVDTVLFMDGDRQSSLRMLYSQKNRFGSTEEVGIFQMREEGIIPIKNPSDFFVTKREKPVVGSVLTVSIEGSRPIVVEVESLVCDSNYSNPMVVSTGVNKELLKMLAAILEQRCGIKVNNKNIYTQVTGGYKISEPAANLGIMMAIASSCKNKPIDNKTVFIGEVGLTGEIKPVNQIVRRLKEIDRMGFKKAYIAKGCIDKNLTFQNLEVVEVSTVKEVLEKVF